MRTITAWTVLACVFAACWLGFASFFLIRERERAVNELALINHGALVEGQVSDTREDGIDPIQWRISYTYSVDGRVFQGSYGPKTGRVPRRYQSPMSPIEVEYDLRSPSVSRPAGTGRDSVATWFLYHAVVILFVLVGIAAGVAGALGFTSLVLVVAGTFAIAGARHLWRSIGGRVA